MSSFAPQAVFEGKVEEAKAALIENPNVIFARTRDWYNAWHLAARVGNMEVSGAGPAELVGVVDLSRGPPRWCCQDSVLGTSRLRS